MIFENWKSDLRASLVVFLVALPLCLGIALASNAPLAAGIYSGVIGGLVVGFLSGSPISVSGPANGLTVIVAAAIATLGSYEAVAVAIFIAGLFQILFSTLRFGVVGDYFPTSVIKGMLAAIGIILILKQLPHAVGFDADYMGDDAFYEKTGGNTFSQLVNAVNFLHLGAVFISGMSISIILIWDKLANKTKWAFFKTIPGPLAAILSAIVVNKMFSYTLPDFVLEGEHLVSLPFRGGVGEFLSAVKLPNWGLLNDVRVYLIGFSIALIGSLESLLSVDAADKIDTEKRFSDKNRELRAQGIGNLVCGLVGGIPIASVIVRSSVNVNSGAKTQLSSIFHSVWILLSVILIPSFLNLIPLPVLASILLVVGYRLANPNIFKIMFHKGVNQFIPFVVTIIAILFSNLLVGIMIGITIGFIFVIRSNIHQSMVLVQDKNLFLIRFFKDVSFLQKAELQKMFAKIVPGSTVIIDGSNSVFVDDDIVDSIEEFMKRAESIGIDVRIKKSSLAICSIFKEV
jgi:MFS superfamily sulfate permease-like transporter